MLEQGDSVIGTYNSNEGSAKELSEKYEKLDIKQVDLTDSESLSSFISSHNEVKLDGIVNNAGIFEEIDFTNFDKKAFEKTFMINTFAPLYLVQGLSQNLKSGASIVNIASTDAMVGSIVGIAYSASKAALINITQSMTNILADRKIRANSLSLGWMGTGMEAPAELLEIARDYNPLKKIGSYEEVAKSVLFLLSEDSSFVNGTNITVDGGDMATNYILQKEAELT